MVIDKGAKTLKLYSLSTSQGGTQMLQTTNLWSFPMCQAKRSATLNFYADTLTIFYLHRFILASQECRETDRESEL